MSKRAPDEDDRYGPATHTCRYCAQVFDVIYETPTRLLVRLMSCKDAMSAFSSCKLIRQLLYPSVLERTSSVYVYLEINIKSHWPNWGFYGRHMEAGVLFTNVLGKIVQKKDIDRNFKSALGTFDLDDVLTDGFDPVNVHNSLWVYAYPSQYDILADDTFTDDTIPPPNLNPNSVNAISSIRKWLSTCIAEHEHQSPADDLSASNLTASSSVLPKRLLKIHHEEEIVTLIETTPSSSRYAVLSYCWGKYETYQTRDTNLATHELGISVSMLPRTLRDAVYVTSYLGIDYLWVDALCIVQNDPAEMQAEIAKMPQVYRGGIVTILAGDAAASNGGMLHRRRRIFDRYKLTLKYLNGLQETVLLDPKVEEHSLEEEETNLKSDLNNQDPVNQRAWIFQEVLLSPRLLYFSPSQVIFQCSTSLFADGGLPEHAFKYRFVFKGLFRSTNGNERAATIVSDQWSSVVALYSELSMSYPSDKLPAISATAQAFNMAYPAPDDLQPCYLAGIWRDNLPYGLLWYRRSNELPEPRPEYRAPSWSWASIDGAVWIPPYKHLIPSLPDCVVASVENCYVLHKSPSNPYGEVVGGRLQITAPMVEVLDYYIAPSGCIYLQDLGNHFITACEGSADALDLSLALPLTPKSGYKMVLLCVIRLPQSQNEVQHAERTMEDYECMRPFSAYYLILLKREETDPYSRIGLLHFETQEPLKLQKRWKDDSNIQMVTIV